MVTICGPAVERASRERNFLGKLTPISHSVIPALKHPRISILDAIRVDAPVIRVKRAVEIGAIAGRQETTGPDVELGRVCELRYRVHDTDLVRHAVIVGIERETNVVRHWSADIYTGVIDLELVGS